MDEFTLTKPDAGMVVFTDLPLLQEVDVPIVVRNPAAGTSVRLLRKVAAAHVSTAPGPSGWNEVILKIVDKYVAN